MLTLLLGFGAGLQHGVQRDFMGLAPYLVFIMPDKTLLGFEGLAPGRKIQMTDSDVGA
jgi:putative ABC transport system permease protein